MICYYMILSLLINDIVSLIVDVIRVYIFSFVLLLYGYTNRTNYRVSFSIVGVIVMTSLNA